MSFSGLCTYPLGGSVSLALIICTCAALAATIYATASCRFVVVSFQSTAGGFEEYFANQREDDSTPLSYKAGVGLFQWLRPIRPDEDWSDGACVGYQETMIDRVSDTHFEVSRTFAVFGILMSVMETLWVFVSACFEMNRLQCILFCLLSFVGTLSTALTFLFHKSAICSTEFDTRECSVDQGGLVMIGAVILWLITFCISVFFVYPSVAEGLQQDFAKSDARDKKKLSQSIAKNRKSRSATAPAQLGNRSYSFDSQKSWTRPIPSRSSSRVASSTAAAPQQQRSLRPQSASAVKKQYVSRKPSSLTVDDVSKQDELEVYVSRRLDRIQQLAEV